MLWASVVVATGASMPAHAQVGDPLPPDYSLPPLADLSIVSEYDDDELSGWLVTVENNRVGRHPGVTVRDVKVKFTPPRSGKFVLGLLGGTHRITRGFREGHYDDSTGVLTIPEIPPVGRVKLIFGTEGTQQGTSLAPSRLHAEIIDSDPVEPPDLQHNNATEHWAMATGTRLGHLNLQLPTVGIGVSERFPRSGGETTFTVTADMFETEFLATGSRTYDKTLLDVQVEVGLSPGLAFARSPQAPAGTSFSTATGIWDVGTLDDDATAGDADETPKSLEVAVRLDGSLEDLPLEERCLTAEVVRSRPWLTFDHLGRENRFRIATVCLGEDPPVVLTSGGVVLVYYYDCVGVTAYPCTDDDTVEMLVRVPRLGDSSGNTGIDLGAHLPGIDRVEGAGTLRDGATWLKPEKVFVQVRHDVGLIRDRHQHSLTGRIREGGTIVGADASWQTGREDVFGSGFVYTVGGVQIGYTLRGFNDQLADWASLTDTLTVSGLDGAAAPGQVRVRFNSRTASVFANPNPTHTRNPYTLTSQRHSTWARFFEFETLGTYVVNWTGKAIRSDTDMTTYNASGTYRFHVGPVSDLEVRDGGADPLVAEWQRAYSVVALNNGPDAAPAVRVTLTGVPEGAMAIAEEGSYTEVACLNSLCEGVWDIGRLSLPEARRASGRIEGPTLTLVTGDGASPDITASIENTEEFSVVVDGKTHSADYFDYVDDNNTATVKGRAGTGRGHPDAPQSVRVDQFGPVALVGWQPPELERVNGFPVTHYQVERNGVVMADAVTGTLYGDVGGGTANHSYRVRAVNSFGVAGPWSVTGGAPGVPGDFTVASVDGGAVLSWSAPVIASSPITGYVIDISDSPDGDNRTNDVSVGNVTTWTHRLSGGDVKFYRVQARNRYGGGGWTAWQSAGAGPGAPGGLRARANGPSEIVLTWNAAPSRDVAIYQYEIEYSDTSASEGYRWLALTAVEGLRYVDESLTPGERRYYRVRATTLDTTELGSGAWSNVASATTSEEGPAPPAGVYAEADGENRIRVTWEVSADSGSYNIEHSTDGAVWESERTRHTGTCNVGGQTLVCYTDAGLFSGTEHWYRVAGVNRSGTAGAWSGPVSAVTDGDPTETPGEPLDLRVTGVSGRRVSLSWDPPEDDGGLRVTGYEYRVEGACVHDPALICQLIAPTRVGGTSATVTVPNVKGQYEFSVRAVSAVGGGWWTQPVGQFVDPQRTWRVTLSPSTLRVSEGGEATYRVRLTADPKQPVMVALDWDGDPYLGNTLSRQQFKWLLPSNYASRNPDIYLDPEYTSPWNVGVPITVTADENPDSDNGTAEIHNTVTYVPCAELGNPTGCVDDPDDTGVTASITVTEQDND